MTVQDTDLRITLSDAQIAGAANSYAHSGIVRIVDLYAQDAADAIHQHLDTEVEWSRVVSQGEMAWDLAPEAIATLDEEKEKAFLAKVHETARDGFQFLFDSRIVSDDSKMRATKGQLLDRVLECLNYPETLDVFRAITGATDLRLINGQATRYDDGIDGEDRIAAYVINLTRNWRTDWGGLLQFHNAAGDVSVALKPGFNTIHLFRVPQMHSVSYVAPFAGVPRYAITGWLRR
jgi:SM-20-related protein